MDFFRSQESLTTMQWILRAVVAYLFLLITAKSLGQRSISQLRFIDFVIALLLGNILAHPLSDERLGLAGSMTTTIVLVVLYLGTSWLSLKWNGLKHFLDPPPLLLIQHGQIHMHNLSKARISLDHLFSELRKQQIEDVQKVALALWEPGGTISMFLETQHQPPAAVDLNVHTSPFALVEPIIIEGVVNNKLLHKLGKNDAWLESKIRAQNQDMKQIALATIDTSEQIRIYKLTQDKHNKQILS
ncbi:DUF421 domain-containing protein [Paenibacillus aestuarii]|uniref:DUF421 domain-containing protein n=1 Tax=Paenibacillus aestuarii TaxID=516965 RepID=A0ABW0KAW7_9BACL|nr:DUF421 domain-containing protein [Paenibacillus aestuarii]